MRCERWFCWRCGASDAASGPQADHLCPWPPFTVSTLDITACESHNVNRNSAAQEGQGACSQIMCCYRQAMFDASAAMMCRRQLAKAAASWTLEAHQYSIGLPNFRFCVASLPSCSTGQFVFSQHYLSMARCISSVLTSMQAEVFNMGHHQLLTQCQGQHLAVFFSQTGMAAVLLFHNTIVLRCIR